MVEEMICEAVLMKLNDDKLKYSADPTYINGLKSYRLVLKRHIPVNESSMCEMVSSASGDEYEIKFKHFPPGAVVAFK